MADLQEALDRLWSDEGLKQRLFSDPKPVLKEFGLDIPAGVSVQVHENSNKVFNAVLPVKPANKTALGSDPLSQIIERAWSDASFKAKLLSDPKEAAAEMGVTLPENIDVKVWENSATEEHIVLPANPVETELSEMELEAVAGGGLSKGAQSPIGCAVGGVSGVFVGPGVAFGPPIGVGFAGASSAASGALASSSGKC